MKTIKKQVEEIINQDFTRHPSREDEDRIERLETICLKLAQQIDNIHDYTNYKP